MTLTRRARKRTTLTAEIRRWLSLDGRYAVDEVNSIYGLPRRYLTVQRLPNAQECVLSRHRKRSAAVRVLEQLVRS